MASVAMITYNHQPYIAQAIEGVLSQKTSFPTELVIGEDCSTDGTREIVLDYKRRYPNKIRLLLWRKNGGQVLNSIETLKAVQGKYIAFCEGDDFFHCPEKLQKQVDFLESHPDYAFVHSDARIQFISTGKISFGRGAASPALEDDNAYFEILTGIRSIYTPTVCARWDTAKAVHEQNPECSDAQWLMGDLQWWLELAHVSKVKYMPEELSTRNDLPESASRSRDVRKMLRFVLSAQGLHEHYLRKYECPPDIALKVRLTQARSALYYAFKALDYAEARQQYKTLKSLSHRTRVQDFLHFTGSRSNSLQRMAKLALKLINGVGRS